ncbi:threonine/serine exporter family protein [Anaerovorax odorimutans]|uniref:Threonine/serine exporter family protein n=1 Tax=Anaerovorax odorimutans TaxID=109327 RepID=A0ABT1RR21_9FIRM|nr:threonine/serine exporter family protein [Anaerovorax odorimutans]MCQ4637606.1 threonine/serine exporter family protein [Anaerovorax odorimutans]
MISAFFFALFATLGFCIIFHVPTRHIPVAACIGGCGWVVYQLFMSQGTSAIVACFIASCAVGLLSDIASRVFKDASTIFTIPGILCLVPGSGMYNTMAALVSGDLKEAASTGSNTLMMAGSIALGLLAVGAVLRIILSIVHRASYIAGKL